MSAAYCDIYSRFTVTRHCEECPVLGTDFIKSKNENVPYKG